MMYRLGARVRIDQTTLSCSESGRMRGPSCVKFTFIALPATVNRKKRGGGRSAYVLTYSFNPIQHVLGRMRGPSCVKSTFIALPATVNRNEGGPVSL